MSHECPTCGDEFGSERGMKIHHVRSHDESLAKRKVDPDIECPTCGRAEFVSELGMKTHHAKEHGESLAGVEVECAACGESTRVPNYRREKRDNHFCDNKCWGEWVSETRIGENHPCWKGGLVKVNCAWCEESKLVPSAEQDRRENHFCDLDCRDKWYSENVTGEDHPSWNGGSADYYGPNWKEQRGRAIKRDNFECVDCGISRDEHYELYGHDLNVHHINPRRNFDDSDYQDYNDIDNLITLCLIDHQKWERIAPLKPQLD